MLTAKQRKEILRYEGSNLSGTVIAKQLGINAQTYYTRRLRMGLGYKPMVYNDTTGRVFGRLTVIEDNGGQFVKAQCSCGNTCTVHRVNLINGHSKSCGCYRKELARTRRINHYATENKNC